MRFEQVWDWLRIQGQLDLVSATGISRVAVIGSDSIVCQSKNDQDRVVSKERFEKWFYLWFNEGKRNNSDFRNETGKKSPAKNFTWVKLIFELVANKNTAQTQIATSEDSSSDSESDAGESAATPQIRRSAMSVEDDRQYPDLSILLREIHDCRKCPSVEPSIKQRAVMPNWDTDLVLMAQAPSEHGVRKSGVHWMDANGNLREKGGRFLEKYLRQIGFSIDPQERQLPRPYITNVVQCWPGAKRTGNGDRKPNKTEVANCSAWWKAELLHLQPSAVLLVGQLPADAVGTYCEPPLEFRALLEAQGVRAEFDGVSIPVFTVPQPVARNRWPRGGRSAYYQLAFSAMGDYFDNVG